jgi:hypothetical protein
MIIWRPRSGPRIAHGVRRAVPPLPARSDLAAHACPKSTGMTRRHTPNDRRATELHGQTRAGCPLRHVDNPLEIKDIKAVTAGRCSSWPGSWSWRAAWRRACGWSGSTSGSGSPPSTCPGAGDRGVALVARRRNGLPGVLAPRSQNPRLGWRPGSWRRSLPGARGRGGMAWPELAPAGDTRARRGSIPRPRGTSRRGPCSAEPRGHRRARAGTALAQLPGSAPEPGSALRAPAQPSHAGSARLRFLPAAGAPAGGGLARQDGMQ